MRCVLREGGFKSSSFAYKQYYSTVQITETSIGGGEDGRHIHEYVFTYNLKKKSLAPNNYYYALIHSAWPSFPQRLFP